MNVDGDIYYKPHLTFIFNNGFLGEMKGRANDKPADRYHDYIVALLKLPIVEGVIGGGYEPENNFELDDLSEEHLEEIREAKGDEFIESEGNKLMPLKKLTEKFKQGEGSPKEITEMVDDILSEYYHGSEYEVYYDTEDGNFKVHNSLEDAAPELSTIRDGFFDFFDAPEIDDFKGFMEDHFIGNIQDSVVRYIDQIYREDIIDFLGLDDDEYDIGVVEDNLDEIIRNVADDVEMSLNRLNTDGYESGSFGELVENVDNALSDFVSDLHFEKINVHDFAEGEDFKIKDNNVYAYVENVIDPGTNFAEEEMSDLFKVEAPYYGYMDFDKTIITDETIESAFSENDIELDYFKKEDE